MIKKKKKERKWSCIYIYIYFSCGSVWKIYWFFLIAIFVSFKSEKGILSFIGYCPLVSSTWNGTFLSCHHLYIYIYIMCVLTLNFLIICFSFLISYAFGRLQWGVWLSIVLRVHPYPQWKNYCLLLFVFEKIVNTDKEYWCKIY